MASGRVLEERGQDHPRTSKRTSDAPRRDVQHEERNTQSNKRSRVSRACDQCRASRERCDGSHPKCQTCSTQNRGCSYNEQPKKRGIQPNYIRTLEITLAWIFQTFPAAEDRLANGLPMDEADAHKLISGKDPTASEELHLAWRNCIVNKQIDQMLSGVTIDNYNQGPASTVDNGDNIDVPYNSPPLSASYDKSSRRQVPDDASTVIQLSSATRLGQLPMQTTAITSEVRWHRLPGSAWTLLEHYFAFTHSWLPMTEKHSILKTMYSYPPEGLQYTHMNGAEHAELWAIMTLAATQLFEGETRTQIPAIRQLAESLIPVGNSSYELPHIKAMITLALTDTQDEHMLAAWLRIGCVVRLLYLFKLLQSLGQAAKWCRHIHLVAFVVESALALHMKTYGHLRVSYIAAIGFVDEDGLDEWSPWSDPLATSHSGGANRAPAKSFSTLNTLVRIYMRSAEQYSTNQDPHCPVENVDHSVFFALLHNAGSKRARVQPSILLAAHGTESGKEVDRFLVDRSEVDLPWILPDPVNSQPQHSRDSSSTNHHHAFMSIPNETSANIFGSSPAMTNPGPFSSTSWMPDLQVNQAFPSTTSPIGLGSESIDIFEELASLERQDSMQHPQFLRNLGFPDLELAEFFGHDYQPSDPLMAYLQPTSFGPLDGVAQSEAG